MRKVILPSTWPEEDHYWDQKPDVRMIGDRPEDDPYRAYGEERFFIYKGRTTGVQTVWLIGDGDDYRDMEFIRGAVWQSRETAPRAVIEAANPHGWSGGMIAEFIRHTAKTKRIINQDLVLGFANTRDAAFEREGITILNQATPDMFEFSEKPEWEHEGQEAAFKRGCAWIEASHGEWALEEMLKLGAAKTLGPANRLNVFVVDYGPTGSGKSSLACLMGQACVNSSNYLSGARLPVNQFATWQKEHLWVIFHENHKIAAAHMRTIKSSATDRFVTLENKRKAAVVVYNAALIWMNFNSLDNIDLGDLDRRLLGLYAPERNSDKVIKILPNDIILGEEGDFKREFVRAMRVGFAREGFDRLKDAPGVYNDYPSWYKEERRQIDVIDQIDKRVIDQYLGGLHRTESKKFSLLKQVKWLVEAIETSDEDFSGRFPKGIKLEARVYWDIAEKLGIEAEETKFKNGLGKLFKELAKKLELEIVPGRGDSKLPVWKGDDFVEPLREILKENTR